MRILGIDPGLVNTGWGVLEKSGTQFKHLNHGVIQPDTKSDMSNRLATIFKELAGVIKSHTLDAIAIEETFVNQNPQSTLKLGMACGIALMAPSYFDIPCTCYKPNQIKKSVVGAGHADKKQMGLMVQMILGLNISLNEHSADALAVAITHVHHLESEKIRGVI